MNPLGGWGSYSSDEIQLLSASNSGKKSISSHIIPKAKGL